MNAFRRNGHDGASVRDLVDVTGVGRGSLYAAFGSKGGLYLAAMDRYRQYCDLPLVEFLRQGAPGRGLLRDVLMAAIDEIVRDGSRRACRSSAPSRAGAARTLAGTHRTRTRGGLHKPAPDPPSAARVAAAPDRTDTLSPVAGTCSYRMVTASPTGIRAYSVPPLKSNQSSKYS